MKTGLLILAATMALVATPASAQGILFNFDAAPLHSPLPLSLTADGITAQFNYTGQGYSIQEAGVLGFTPAGFSGYCVYPSSVFPADLIVIFSQSLTDFSILYAPEEYACDSSATMRLTASQNGAFVGTATANAQPGTWPTAALAFSSAQGFDMVVIHYDAPPVTGGDYGPIFMVDNMTATAAPEPGTGTTLILGLLMITGNWRRLATGTSVVGLQCRPDTTVSKAPPLSPCRSLRRARPETQHFRLFHRSFFIFNGCA